MSDYPSNMPWGPHGPQTSVPTTTPNPTASTPDPGWAPAPDAGWGSSAPAASGSYSSGGGGGGSLGGAASPARWFFPAACWLAVAGGVVGLLAGGVRAYSFHLPPATVGAAAIRFGIAGAASGASIPPFIRAAGSLVRSAIWIGMVAILWLIALAALGRLDWLNRLR